MALRIEGKARTEVEARSRIGIRRLENSRKRMKIMKTTRTDRYMMDGKIVTREDVEEAEVDSDL